MYYLLALIVKKHQLLYRKSISIRNATLSDVFSTRKNEYQPPNNIDLEFFQLIGELASIMLKYSRVNSLLLKYQRLCAYLCIISFYN